MIYDTFAFFNELELLELRLCELAEVVDKFVLVEATRTHTNKPKPLYYFENRERFSAFADKIIHVVVEDPPDSADPWVLERFQRNCISRGLRECRPDDFIMVSDLDEIPRGTAVEGICHELSYHHGLGARLAHGLVKAIATTKPLRKEFRKFHPYVWKFQQAWYCYFLNCPAATSAPWYGTRLVYYRDFTTADLIRYSGYQIVENGGWHFGWMGGVERVQQKLISFAHQEFNKPEFTAPERVEAAMNSGGRPVPLDESFPRYVREHQEKFAGWIKPL